MFHETENHLLVVNNENVTHTLHLDRDGFRTGGIGVDLLQDAKFVNTIWYLLQRGATIYGFFLFLAGYPPKGRVHAKRARQKVAELLQWLGCAFLMNPSDLILAKILGR
ncbi:hypothetical protein DESC_260081 [Desulfosarcina cetonica]|nr:hypothetical protein DESC_260081 [Desulfosarcina cetonica]